MTDSNGSTACGGRIVTNSRRRQILFGAGIALASGSWSSIAFAANTPEVSGTTAEAAIANPLRTDADRKSDATRHPLEFYKFTGVKTGMNVLDVSAGGGYTTELMALAVGSTGKVFAQLTKPHPALEKRLADHPQPNIDVLIRPTDDPYPADGPKLDLITLILSYHDIAYTDVDRAKMNKAFFNALKPGGTFVVIDHAARAGTGVKDTHTLHRIDEKTVLKEVMAAGFKLDAESDFLRNPKDLRDKAFFNLDIPSDKFALRFEKPKQAKA